MKKNFLITTLLISTLCLSSCSIIKNLDTNKSIKNSEKTTRSSKNAESESDFVAQASKANFSNNILKGNSYSVRITDYKVIQPGEEGNESEQPFLFFSMTH